MIVWLASYPRSGNTLLRQVLKACFDLNSCEGLERYPSSSGESYPVQEEFGGYFAEGNPEEFYRRARGGSELVLIKSHLPPRDDAKAIYVVRDGRLALKSFLKLQNAYYPGTASFESLLVGDHAYGSWSDHYRAWCEDRRGETMVLRFEELVSADAAILARLTNFLGLPGPVRPWVNPLVKLRERDPVGFGSGERAWAPDSFWTEARLRQIYTLHGPLLARLGYATPAEVEAGAYPPGSDGERLVRLAHDLATRRNGIQAVCDERLEIIESLSAACAERLEVINRLDTTCREQSRTIHQLDQTVAELRRTSRPALRGLLDRLLSR